MGVHIKGMKMPSGCISCPFKSYGTIDEFKYYCDMTGAFVGRWSGKKINKRHKDCPLMELKEREDGLYERVNQGREDAESLL